MAAKQAKHQRRATARKRMQAQRDHEEAHVPLAPAAIKALFDTVDAKLSTEGCDHTLRHTVAFLETHQLSHEPVIAWLATYNGYCDCEVIANVEERWGEAGERR